MWNDNPSSVEVFNGAVSDARDAIDRYGVILDAGSSVSSLDRHRDSWAIADLVASLGNPRPHLQMAQQCKSAKGSDTEGARKPSRVDDTEEVDEEDTSRFVPSVAVLQPRHMNPELNSM